MDIEQDYRQRTERSAELQQRARSSITGGSTRSVGWHRPYPVVFARGEGPRLIDVDGHDYIDYLCNGLSLIHGHAYEPVRIAVEAALQRGSAWPQATEDQIEFAELIVDRLPHADLVRFANTGTEAAMLAVKLARFHTGRPLLLKAQHAYHGSYDDLEAGLGDKGEIRDRVLLARFGDIEGFTSTMRKYADEIACVILETVMFTGVVVPPPEGFLQAVQATCEEIGALFIIDDCLMLRLAHGGSQEKFGLRPDLTVMGKFVGGGLPVGIVAGTEEVMSRLDPYSDHPMYHGGSFNGNLLGVTAGYAAMVELTEARIVQMNAGVTRLAGELPAIAAKHAVPLSISSFGSVMGIYATETVPVDAASRSNNDVWRLMHLALMNNGVYVGNEGEMATTTLTDDALIDQTLDGFDRAFQELSAQI